MSGQGQGLTSHAPSLVAQERGEKISCFSVIKSLKKCLHNNCGLGLGLGFSEIVTITI